MTFIITLIALLIERFFDWNHIRKWRWFLRYQSWLAVRLSAWLPSLILTLSVGLPVLAVALVNNLLAGILFGIFKLVFGIVVVVYCLGPANFWSQFYMYAAAIHKDDAQAATESAKSLFALPAFANPQEFHRVFTSAIFIEANSRIFAVIFWYILLGPAGAVLYRLVDLSHVKSTVVAPPAEKFQRILDWLPVRVLSFLFALGGHFTQVIQRWKKQVLDTPAVNDVLLSECGIVALDVTKDNHFPEDGTIEQEAVSLLDRVFVITLVLLAIIVLV
jgi:AmpE protein